MGSWERFCSGFIASFTFVSPDVLVTSGLIPCVLFMAAAFSGVWRQLCSSF